MECFYSTISSKAVNYPIWNWCSPSRSWSKKIGSDFVKSDIGTDPASVGYKTAKFAKDNKSDLAFIDTAGRLQNKKNLMEEYKKIFTVLKKINPEYPHETILVLDATTGQNALNQVEEFKKISNLTGLIITKLDTSAKGGILLAISKKYNLPIVAVGMGEKETDLHPFKAEKFTKALLSLNWICKTGSHYFLSWIIPLLRTIKTVNISMLLI